MSSKELFSKNWLKFVAESRRREFLEILEELSRLYTQHNVPFILIGASSLLMRGCLRYLAWWDFDLLFDSEEDLLKFHQLPKSESIQIFNVDPQIIQYEHLSSLQSMWGVRHIWYRMDYIFRKNYYQFHLTAPQNSLIYQEQFQWEDHIYRVHLPVAHPWNMFIDKLLSSRLQWELNSGELYSIDIRHLFSIFTLYHKDKKFWEYVGQKADELGERKQMKSTLRKLLDKREELGYSTISVTQRDLNFVEGL
ncbi:MAG: hypothetical protein Kow0042_07370 [Calditrichia bacterium]